VGGGSAARGRRRRWLTARAAYTHPLADMSASLFGAALRASRTRVATAARQTRMMSAEAAEHQAHHEASMKQWEKIT